ncbi:RNase adapter RapZ [Desulfobulbus sp.]|uniref:RapZ C-terminal domain-containing protein n=1 Tax=Desulfobulbus sp. TaxID=895 RepID=UPI00286F43FF|nr:RNase adapter RapZ [Desulfobulbus sp.]
MKITLFSFGFKHGYPEADVVWDVRFLPNPYWVPELRSHTGLETEVAGYVLANEPGERFLELLEPLLVFTLAEHAARGRESLTLAMGCTGGKHRSVALVEHLRLRLTAKGYRLEAYHRDIDKE